LEASSEGQREISRIIQDILKSFCDCVEQLATERSDDEIQQSPNISQMIGFPANNLLPQSITINESGKSGVALNSVITWEHRLLCCMANSAYCNKHFFHSLGNLFQKYGYPVPKLAIENSRSNINLVFGNLLDIYVEHKSDPLVGTIEPSMYIGHFAWDSVESCNKLSPYAHECLDNIIGVYSEIFCLCPFLLRPILEQIVQTVAEELARLMACIQKFNTNGALQANIDIKLIKDAVRVYSNERAK
jgi:exocyst complex component 2